MNRLGGERPWGKRKACWYSEALLYSDYADKVRGVIRPVVRGCSSLLDVGAGCGALCIPLARDFDRVSALDASEPMLDELRKRADSEGIRNIRTEAATWEAAAGETGRFDVVLCANVPDVLNDPEESVPRLERHAERYVFLVLGTARNSNKFFFHELWPLIFKTSFPRKEDYLATRKVLHRMGILASVAVVDYSFDQPFRDIEQAVLFWKEHMRLDGDAWDGMLREFLSGKLGRWGDRLWARIPKQSAVIWWQPSVRSE